jgi:hypothetical protein
MRHQKWANKLTAAFWLLLVKDPKASTYWRTYAHRQYRRNLTDEPMPGIWPKFNARSEVALGLYDTIERRTSGVPRGFLDYLGETSINEVDCYSLAERLLNDDVIAAIDATSPARRRGHPVPAKKQRLRKA